MGSPAAPSPYQQVTTREEMPQWKKELLGLTPNAPEYSPYKALSRQGGTLAKMYEGVTTKPTWSSLYQYYGVPQGTDLTPYIQATRQGIVAPSAPIPASPAAGTIPEFTPPSETSGAKKKEAAQGGLMSLARPRGYAEAGKVKALTSQQQQYVKNISKAIQDGNVTQKQIDRLNTIEKNSGLNVSPYSDTGTGTPKNPTIANLVNKTADVYTKQQADATAPSLAPPGAAEYKTAFFSGVPAAEKDVLYGGSTNPIIQQALDQLRAASKAPDTIGQGAGIMSQAGQDLLSQAGFTPQQIAAQDVTGSSIGQIAGIAAPTAVASSYDASQMVGPERISAQGYDAAQMNAATMQGAQNIAANRLQQYQMDRDRIRNLQAQRAQVAEMTGPESWTQRGVAEKYMNPYVKTALASQQELANLDLQKQLQQIQGQAAGAGAFGGSKTQLALASARRNQDLANRNMAAQGLSQAYTQGMGQFTTEQQMSQAAKNANQAAANAANLDYVARQFAAQQANQGMDYNTALQNMQAKLGVQQAQQQADLAASQANQLYGYGGFQSQAQNLASLNQASANNMQAINNQRSQYVTQALQAAQANQQATLTTEQANMVARNAAAQFNAQNATQISQANAQMNLAAQQSNQQVAYNTAAQNAQLAQAANLANQQAALTAATQNQQAGLTAQGLNLQALNQAGQVGQGLGALGVSAWGQQQAVLPAWGSAAQNIQALGQSAVDNARLTASQNLGGMGAAYGPSVNILTGTPGSTTQQNVNRIPQ